MAPVPAIAGPARTRAEGAGPRCPTAKGGAGRAARALAGGRIAEGDTAGQGRRRSLQGRLAPAPSEPPPPLALINPTQAYATCPRPHSHFARSVHQWVARRAAREPRARTDGRFLLGWSGAGRRGRGAQVPPRLGATLESDGGVGGWGGSGGWMGDGGADGVDEGGGVPVDGDRRRKGGRGPWCGRPCLPPPVRGPAPLQPGRCARRSAAGSSRPAGQPGRAVPRLHEQAAGGALSAARCPAGRTRRRRGPGRPSALGVPCAEAWPSRRGDRRRFGQRVEAMC